MSAAAANAIGLQNAVDDAQDNGGGTILMPSNDANDDGSIYYIASPTGANAAVTVLGTAPLRFLGAGNGTILMMTDAHDLFSINVAANDVGGFAFQDMQIQYSAGLASGAAVHVLGGAQNVRLFRVVFIDCPRGVFFDGSLQGSMLECTAVYGANTGVAVTLGSNIPGHLAEETYIAACRFSAASSGESLGGKGLAIVQASHARIVNTQIEAFQQGVVIIPGAVIGSASELFFSNVTVSTTSPSTTIGAALLIQPEDGRPVSRATFVDCTFGAYGDTSYQGGGVLIDAADGTIDQLKFVSCYSCLWSGSGIEITSGSNVEILGGYYCCNGQHAVPKRNGISLSGPATNVRIIGATCNNSIPCTTAEQQHGILVGAGAESVYIRGCDLYGNVNAPLLFSSPGSHVEVTNCHGYNDQPTILSAALLEDNVQFNNTTFGYYGPMAFYVSGGAVDHINIDTKNTTLTSGGFILAPGETAKIKYSGAPSFLFIGK